MGKNFGVTIPENAQELIGLNQRVLNKHILDGAGSVLTPLNMADYQAKNTLAKDRDVKAAQFNKDKETAYENRDLALGIGSPNPDTVDYYVKSSRDILLGIYKGREQRLGDHGFNVNASSGFVSVEMPTDAPGMMALADLILKKHVLDGAASPLNGLNMADFTAKQATATDQHTKAQQLNRDKEKANRERDQALGIADGQRVDTPGTAKFYLVSSRDVLLGNNKGKEYNLGDWGFDVQYSSGAGAPTGTFIATPSSIAAGATSNLAWNIIGSATVSIDNGIGSVAASGNITVTPAATTAYKLTATASGKTLSIQVTVTVV